LAAASVAVRLVSPQVKLGVGYDWLPSTNWIRRELAHSGHEDVGPKTMFHMASIA